MLLFFLDWVWLHTGNDLTKEWSWKTPEMTFIFVLFQIYFSAYKYHSFQCVVMIHAIVIKT